MKFQIIDETGASCNLEGETKETHGAEPSTFSTKEDAQEAADKLNSELSYIAYQVKEA